jgi:putative transcriptional regulator
MWLALTAIFIQIAVAQQIQASRAKSVAAGTILVATAKSHDSDLKHSVVLVIRSGPEGVIGLILNRPVEQGSYFGGPLPIGVRTLIRSASKPENSEPILAGVFVVPGKLSGTNSRTFAGYVGWSAQQVKNEIAQGLWTARPGDVATVFDADPKTLWDRLSR